MSDEEGLLDISNQLGHLSIGVGLSGRPAEPLTEIDEIAKENILAEFQQARSEQRCKVSSDFQISVILTNRPPLPHSRVGWSLESFQKKYIDNP